ncbi:PD40 domain-containing protein [candidate division TA06 bacterium]|uniref:PD40 domain-containing protein n=1 Tax=candidate division TA06 bacterium TaxID=2250710 RepID=A0A933I9V9_UNCT6|nr:PD40 domain-containing protein [candidate division TA06 bacterium]
MSAIRFRIPAICLVLVLAALSCGRNAALDKGRQFLEIGDLGKAIEQFSKAVQDDPKQPLGHYYLAKSYCLTDSAVLARKEYGILSRLDYQAAQDTFLRQKVAVFSGLEPYALTRLTFSPGNDALPVLSPDGTKIAFSSKRDGNPEIYIMDASGQNPKRITNNPDLDYMPSFSPDGKSLAYISDRDGNNEIYLFDLQSQKERRMTANKFDDLFPRFSPDGGEIYFLSDRDGRYEIWRLVPGKAGQPQKMEMAGEDKGNINIFDISGGQFVYQQEQENQVFLKSRSLTGGDARQINCPSFRAGLPTILSPDGRYLLYTSSRQGNDEVYLYDRQTDQNLRLTVNPAEDVAFGMFPGQKTVLFDSQRDGDREIYLLHLDRLISTDQIIKAQGQ